MKTLIANGADVNAIDIGGNRPVDEALRRGHKDIAESLTSKADGVEMGK